MTIGFICEGKTEKNIIESKAFQYWLSQNGLSCITPAIDAEGGGNLLPNRIDALREVLLSRDAQVIIILTDLDTGNSITATRHRIIERTNQIIVVAVKQIEAWFLSDTSTLQALFNNSTFAFDQPEQEENPFLTLQRLFFYENWPGRWYEKYFSEPDAQIRLHHRTGCPAPQLRVGTLLSN